jgi:hypothetical protein
VAAHVLDLTQEREEVEYIASRTASRFHRDRASFVRGIRGPVGSGKTTACCWDIWMLAHEAAPGKDGVRRSRWLAVRNTYGDLKATTIQTWEHWFGPQRGPGFGKIVYDVPIRQKIRIEYPPEQGGPVELDMWFLALDRPEHVKKLKSLEVTGVWLNEASELPKAVLDMATSRVGRYPHPDQRPADHAGIWPNWSGVIMDTNSMDDDHWWYGLAEIERPSGFRFFDQPGGMDPHAENIRYLPGERAYYQRMMQGKTEEWIKVFVHNNYGSVQDGKAVYAGEYNDRLHVSPTPLAVYRGLPLRLGFDFGLTPACMVAQLSPRGQLRFLREYVAEDMGIERFVQTVVKPALNNEFAGMTLLGSGDPGGTQRAQTNEQTCIDILNAEGIPTTPTSTNVFQPRRNALTYFLTRLIDGEPALILDPSIKMFRKGLNGGYRYKRLAVAGEERYRDEPDKNRFSHPVEAGQYLALPIVEMVKGGEKERAAAVARARNPAPRRSRRYGY